MTNSFVGTVAIFDDEETHDLVSAIHHCLPQVKILVSRFADVKPTPNKPDSSEPLTAAYLNGESVDAAIIDLKMNCLHDQNAKRHPVLGGLYTLEMLGQADKPIEGFVYSGWIGNTSVETQLASLRSKDWVTFYSKDRPEDLLTRLWAMFDLKQRLCHTTAPIRDELCKLARRMLAPSSKHALILGESGTGKELAAQHIHSLANFYAGLTNHTQAGFAIFLCSAYRGELARCELFGHIKGAFTDARDQSLGAILRALVSTKPGGGKTERLVIDRALRTTGAALRDVGSNYEILKGEKDFTKVGERLVNLGAALAGLGDVYENLEKSLDSNLKRLENKANGQKEAADPAGAFRKTLLDTGLFKSIDSTEYDLQITENAPLTILFLDEFGELSEEVQSLLLRFLESGDIHPIGYPGRIIVKDHVRVIAATNRVEDIELALQGKPSKIRPDIVYRLTPPKIELPPLHWTEIPDHVAGVQREGNFDDITWPHQITEVLTEKAKAAGGRLFPGHRRQLRKVIAEAFLQAREAVSLGRAFSPTVTQDILQKVLDPIKFVPLEQERYERLERDKLICILIKKHLNFEIQPSKNIYEATSPRLGTDREKWLAFLKVVIDYGVHQNTLTWDEVQKDFDMTPGTLFHALKGKFTDLQEALTSGGYNVSVEKGKWGFSGALTKLRSVSVNSSK